MKCCIHPHKSMKKYYWIESYISCSEFLILDDAVIGLPITKKSDPLSIAIFWAHGSTWWSSPRLSNSYPRSYKVNQIRVIFNQAKLHEVSRPRHGYRYVRLNQSLIKPALVHCIDRWSEYPHLQD